MKNIIYEKFDQVGLLRINRPQVLNALNKETLEELVIFLDLIGKAQQTKALVITGAGEKAFIAGADIKEMQSLDHLGMVTFSQLGQKVSLLLENAPFITIAAVNGYALGGGFEMALACDMIYAAPSAKFGLPEINMGIIPGFGGTQRLSRAVGTRLAKEMIFSGKTITAEEAKELGIVNQIYPSENLLHDTLVAATAIIKHSFTALKQAKNAINWGYSLGMPEALELEKSLCALCFATPEREEAMKAFTEKRKGNGT